MKKSRDFKYRLMEDIKIIFIVVVMYSALIAFAGWYKDTVPSMDNIIIINYMIYSYNFGYNKYHQYITFGFDRRKFFREQVVSLLIRAGVMSIFRASVQWIYVEQYIQEFFMEESIRYHKVTFMEMIVTNLCMFILLELFLMVNSTAKIDILIGNFRGQSPRLKERIEEQKRKLKGLRTVLAIFIKTIGFIMFVVGGTMSYGYYSAQMTKPLLYRVEVIGGMMVLSLILYFIGKKRFSPKYI